MRKGRPEMLHGYGGFRLRVDLTSGRLRREKTDPRQMLKVIGGRGLNSALLHETRPPDNASGALDSSLLVGVGPLTGTLLAASAPVIISGRSPLTGSLIHSAAGGFFGPELKQAGYDQIVITGRAAQPCYLLICDDRVELCDAHHLWDLEIRETTRSLRHALNDNAAQVAPIGPAGDRSGPGGLFDAKNLKAIVVRGTGGLNLADPLEFLALCRHLDEKILAHPEYATPRAVSATRAESAAGGFMVRTKACFNCPLPCPRDGQAVSVESTDQQDLLSNCLTICQSIGARLDLDFAARLLQAATGLHVTAAELDRVLNTIIDQDRRLAIEFGSNHSRG